MIPIAKPQIGEEEIKAVEKVLRSGMIAQGKKVKEFEEKFAEYIGTKYAVAVSNGTTALHLALLASGIGQGDEIITTPFSFIASSNCILSVGAKPVFVDIDSASFNINPDLIEKKITLRTKALLIVHLFGNPCQMDKILPIVKEHKLALIEDCCQAHGAKFEGKKVGLFGTGCFSFYATKNMTTGEGGMITTSSFRLAERLRLLREHGSKVRYYHDSLGFNFQMTDIQAAIGIEQLKKLDEFNKKRIENALYFNRKISKTPGIITPAVNPKTTHVFHQYTLRLTDKFPLKREKLIEFLTNKGIDSSVFYPLPIHKQKLYKKLGYKDKLPVAEQISGQVISLPIIPGLSKSDLDLIVKALKEAGRK